MATCVWSDKLRLLIEGTGPTATWNTQRKLLRVGRGWRPPTVLAGKALRRFRRVVMRSRGQRESRTNVGEDVGARLHLANPRATR